MHHLDYCQVAANHSFIELNSAPHLLHQPYVTPSRYFFISKAKLKIHEDPPEEKCA
ncbi:hypothetical protein [Nitrosomonas communis]|jgi:hypothetical protein|uniref:Uncharacterized protein n=1 Tax=Nitrosomonas communis TaxID=44574 RepID=A0A1I4L7W7_9PROT|nr:hypothetical protein [Nitrosomonas communis]SFL87128.1 hypothetical protein SAMN05421863_100613 [Nitrosomonas communis]